MVTKLQRPGFDALIFRTSYVTQWKKTISKYQEFIVLEPVWIVSMPP
jgi:hypothetical protein